MQTRSSPNRSILSNLAEVAQLQNIDKLSKEELFKRIKDSNSLDRLMRIENRRKRKIPVEEIISLPTSEVHESFKRAKLNKFDPIMFIPIGKKKTFKFVRPNGSVVQFNVDTLVDYLLISGDFMDPETRLPFSEEDLAEIDKIAKELELNKPSVLAAKKNIHAYSEAKFRRDALLALERCAGEVVTDMLSLIENVDPDIAQMHLATNEFPLFSDFFRQLKDAEPDYAAKCLAHWRLYVAGPPNKPNRDEFGLVKIVGQFLKGCEDFDD